MEKSSMGMGKSARTEAESTEASKGQFIDRRPKKRWKGRSLDNYKKMHEHLAQEKGVATEFLASSTLTKAKKILKGIK